MILGGVPVKLARNSAAAEKRGRAKIPSPQPPSFLPARASDFVPAARSAATIQFLSKKVRAELYNSTKTELNGFFKARRWDARSAWHIICFESRFELGIINTLILREQKQ